MRTEKIISCRKEYMNIIFNAKFENRIWEAHKYELHHILPKANSLFPNWDKRKSNLVLLYPHEHIKCHKLLAHIYGGGMWDAYWYLAIDRKDGHELTPEEYESVRIKHSNRVSTQNYKLKPGWKKGHRPWNYGLKMSDDFKQKISEKLKGNTFLKNKGGHTPEAKEKIRQSRLGKLAWNSGTKGLYSEEYRKKISDSKKGKKMPDYISEIRSKESSSRKWYTDGINDKFAKECPTGFWKGKTKCKGWKNKLKD